MDAEQNASHVLADRGIKVGVLARTEMSGVQRRTLWATRIDPGPMMPTQTMFFCCGVALLPVPAHRDLAAAVSVLPPAHSQLRKMHTIYPPYIRPKPCGKSLRKVTKIRTTESRPVKHKVIPVIR